MSINCILRFPRRSLFVVMLLTFMLKDGSGLKCWQCSHDLNWEKCLLTTSETCKSPKTRCGAMYTKQGNVETYKRDCFTEEFCTKKPVCTSSFSKCEIKCCHNKDGCNVFTTSGSMHKPLSAFFVCLFAAVMSLLYCLN